MVSPPASPPEYYFKLVSRTLDHKLRHPHHMHTDAPNIFLLVCNCGLCPVVQPAWAIGISVGPDTFASPASSMTTILYNTNACGSTGGCRDEHGGCTLCVTTFPLFLLEVPGEPEWWANSLSSVYAGPSGSRKCPRHVPIPVESLGVGWSPQFVFFSTGVSASVPLLGSGQPGVESAPSALCTSSPDTSAPDVAQPRAYPPPHPRTAALWDLHDLVDTPHCGHLLLLNH